MIVLEGRIVLTECHSSTLACLSLFAAHRRWIMIMLYLYGAVLAARRVKSVFAAADVQYDVALTLGGALTCLTVPLATLLVSLSFNCNAVQACAAS
jgi:hypothetical protein